MLRKYRITLLFTIFFIVYVYGSIDSYKNLMHGMYKTETAQRVALSNEKKESSEPSIISLSNKELSYHHLTAMILMDQCGDGLVKKMEMVEVCENYGRALYKIKTIIKLMIDSNVIFREVIYYVYVFVDNTIPKKPIEQWINVVCVLEKDKALLNFGFRKNCVADNNWLYWRKKESCPDILYIEHELKKAFNLKLLWKAQNKKMWI